MQARDREEIAQLPALCGRNPFVLGSRAGLSWTNASWPELESLVIDLASPNLGPGCVGPKLEPTWTFKSNKKEIKIKSKLKQRI